MRKKILITIFLSLFTILICFNSAFASSFLSDKTETNYNANNGLLTGKANTLCQTDDGYIWIGQYAGLTRYDARSFKTDTTYQDHDLTGITSIASYQNKVIIGTQNGLFIKDEYDNVSEIDTLNEKISIHDIKVYSDVAFIASDTGVYLYSFTNNTIKLDPNGKGNIVKVAPLDDKMYFYIDSSYKVYGSLSSNVSEYYKFTPIKSVYYSDEHLYMGEQSGNVLVKNVNTNEITTIDIGGNQCVNDIIIHDNIIYMATDTGLFISENNQVRKVDNLEAKGFIQRIIVDYENNIWLASSSFGVSKITTNELFDYFFEFNLESTSVNAIEKYNSLTYIATSTGLYIVDENNGSIENELVNLLKDVRIRDLEVYKNKLYIATYDSNLYDLIEYDSVTGTINQISSLTLAETGETNYNNAGQVRCLRVAGNYLLIGTNYGLSRFDGTNYYNKKLSKRVLYIYYGNDTVYLALEETGFAITDLEFNTPIIIDDKLSSPLKCLYVNGALLFNNNNKLFYYKDDKVTEIKANFVGSVVELAYIDNKYVIGTDTNIYICDDIFSDNLLFEILDSNNGLKSSLVANSSGYYDSSTNCYYFTTAGGIFVHDFSKEKEAKIRRKVAIDGVSIDDKEVDINNINLSSDANRITIYFAVLSNTLDQHYTVYYKLNGVDNEYNALQSTETFKIDYTNLRGGKYELSIYTLDSDGTRSQNDISLTITKDKAYFETVWFWVLIAVLGLLVIGALNFIFITNRNKKAKKREAELKGITIESIEAIARTIDAKDTYTNGHSIRVGHASRIIAEALGMEGDELENLYYIALLHDIGKIGIPDAILNKPGRLTDEEFEIMKSHTTKGAAILKDISTIPNIEAGAKYHHERYGGGGYPEGLKGEEIPYIARIICCADCFDAMATRRVYKDPYPKEKIISEFERCKEIQFDPHMADVVIKLIKEGKLKA